MNDNDRNARRPRTTEDMARKTVSRLRGRIAEKPQRAMFDKGALWREHARQSGRLEAIETLSRANLARLRMRLRKLTPLEHHFVTSFDKRPFYATHFTPNERDSNGETTLFSRKKLFEKSIDFDEAHTTDLDIDEAGNDDYVFFSLECGRTPKKTESRFGDVLYRFDLQSSRVASRFEHAWLSLNDMVAPDENKLRRRYPGLPQQDYDTVDYSRYVYNKAAYVFSGGSMMVGVALSIVELTRQLSAQSHDRLLSVLTDDETDRTLNGLFRPELKLARFLITDDFEKSIRAPGGNAPPPPAPPAPPSPPSSPATHGPASRFSDSESGYDSDSDSASQYSQD